MVQLHQSTFDLIVKWISRKPPKFQAYVRFVLGLLMATEIMENKPGSGLDGVPAALLVVFILWLLDII